MKKQPDVTLVIACYREEEILAESMKRIYDVFTLSSLTYEIIYVDDKSPDNTVREIKKMLKTYPHARAIYHKKNTGRGQAVMDGIAKARGKVVGFIDVDLEVSPVYIPIMVGRILAGGADMVIGKRIYRAPFHSILRVLYSIAYQWGAGKIIPTGGLDTETGYKFFDTKKIKKVLKKTQHPHWFWDTEIVVYARLLGLRVEEFPVLFVRRLDKESTVNPVEDITDYIVSLGAFRKRLKREGYL